MESFKIVLYGLGKEYEKIRDTAFTFHDVVAITDTYKSDDDKYQNYYVNPERLKNIEYDRILICSQRYNNEILQRLVYELGVERRKIVTYPFVDGFIFMGLLRSMRLMDESSYKKRIFVCGDSHSWFFGSDGAYRPVYVVPGVNVSSDKLNHYTVFHLGPCLANSMCGYGHTNSGHEKINALCDLGLIPEDSKLICCFGEIDIRVHVLMQAMEQRCSVERIVDSIVDKYVAFLKEIKEHNDVYAWGPIPSCKDGCVRNPSYPYFGSEVDRNKATEYFNKRLQIRCNEEEIGFISIYDSLMKDYYTLSEYYRDNVHIGENAWKIADPVISRVVYKEIQP